jgi:signal transduction histidine kinase
MRSLRLRIVLAVLGALALAVVLHAAVVTRELASVLVHGLVSVFEPVRDQDLDACEAAPATWFLAAGRWTAHAYDPETLLSANPGAPPLDPALRSNLRWTSDGRAMRLVGLGFAGNAAVARPTGRGGPCGLVVLRWPVEAATRDALRWRGLLNLVGVTLLATSFALLVAIRPLARSVARLAVAARNVGRPDFSAPTDEPGDLGTLARAIAQSHEHVLDEQQREMSERAALERHLADIAHDLRTPLASLQLRLEELAVDDDPRITASLDDVVYLGLLVENLHTAARLRETHAGHLPITDLAAVVDRVTARFELIGRCRHVSVQGVVPDAPVRVRAESVLVEQAIANLLHNAVAHNDPGGNVAVVLSTRDGHFDLVVQDDGPGVAPEQLPRLTDRTFRTDDARARDRRGSGLGLAIVREICDQSRFTLTFEIGCPRGLVVRVGGRLEP